MYGEQRVPRYSALPGCQAKTRRVYSGFSRRLADRHPPVLGKPRRGGLLDGNAFACYLHMLFAGNKKATGITGHADWL